MIWVCDFFGLKDLLGLLGLLGYQVILLSSAAPSQAQLTRVTSTSPNCCSSQRFLCFYLDFESDISSRAVDRTRDC
jgi:hypothetical protein